MGADGPDRGRAPIVGAAIVGFPLLGLGVPWSLPVIFADPIELDPLSIAGWYLVHFGPAVLTVLLQGAVLALAGWVRRRRERSIVGAAQR